MPIEILLVDDQIIPRQGLRSLLEKNADFRVVGEAGDGYEARDMAQKLRPNVVILDVGIPGLNGIEATRLIREELPEVNVIGLYGHADKSFMTSMVRAGASGYLYKSRCSVDDLFQAVRDVAAGRVYVNSDMMEMILREYRQDGTQPNRANTTLGVKLLDANECDVLKFLAEGASVKDIAEQLKVCQKTVTRTRDKIMDKLVIFSIAGLTKFAVRNGLTSLE